MNNENNSADEAFLAEFLDDYYAECDEHLTVSSQFSGAALLWPVS